MRNRNFIAQTVLGDCPLCCLRLDVGEWVSQRANGRLIHLGCVPKAATADTAPTLFSLTSDNELETAIETANATVERAKKTLGVREIVFDGSSCMGVDLPRLAGQIERVFLLMKDSRFRTLEEIARATNCLETSASSRLRDLKKTKFGSHSIYSRPRTRKPLVYEYQLIVNEKRKPDEQRNAA